MRSGKCTNLTVISCLSDVQASTPSGSQPLTLRALRLPLSQGTALMMTALSARHFVLSFCAHTQRITEFAAKPRDFRMERHVLGSGRSVSGRRRGSPRRLRNVTLRRKAALFAPIMTKNISNEFQKEIRLKIFRNKGFAPTAKRTRSER